MNMKELGMMKVEYGDLIIVEFVGVRPKAYAIISENEKEELEEKMAAKGVSKTVLRKKIRFNDYKRCLFEGINLSCEQKLIRNHLHRVYSTKQTKLALNADDDKRLILDDGVNTKALGYRRSE
ncbi:hypothetical protein QAD02_003354 [Eretmocerus hayati]|uniref:Uncharacterized protein n=1 Tax=Eretmocerus hayati TaxID=131215 RepID=A0ACC2NLM6_9HYME|nr:hypothetical protein QAD02_003354 [Eretmocerus hayati]